VRYFYFLILSGLFLAIDLATKVIAANFLAAGPVTFSESFKLELHQNVGIAFSLPVPLFVQLVTTPILISVVIMWFIERKKMSKPELLAFSALSGGALGNFIQRLFHGAVTDFIWFSFWPTFNFADIFIVTGSVFILLKIFAED